jgi:hypothetical protein
MAASYPTSIAGFLDKVNVVDIIDASHPNSIQSEVIAIETTLGTEPNRSTTPSSSGTFNGASNLFSTVGLRLNNIETGVVSDAHTQYLRKAGDTTNVITVGASTTKGLVIKGAASQSANLQEWQNTGGTVLSSIDSAGNHVAASFVRTGGTSSQFLKADGSVDSSTYLTTGTAASTYLTSATAATTYEPKFSLNTNVKSGTYTLVPADYNTMVQMASGGIIDVTTGLSGAPVGTQIHLMALGRFQVRGVSTALNGTPGLFLRAGYSTATLICFGTNNWLLTGDLSA